MYNHELEHCLPIIPMGVRYSKIDADVKIKKLMRVYECKSEKNSMQRIYSLYTE